MQKPLSLITAFLRSTLVIALVASGLIGYFWVSFEYDRFHEETEKLRQNYLTQHKNLLKDHVDNAALFVQNQRSKTEARLKQTIQSRTNEAYAIALNIYQENRAKKSMPEIQEMVKQSLRAIRFHNGRGYYFALTMDGRQELFADQPQMEGRLLLDIKDTRGRYVFRDMIALAKEHQEGFITYHWTKPGQAGRDYPKIAFIRSFGPFDWIIGTGEYLDDFEKDIQAEAFEYLHRLRQGQSPYLFGFTNDGAPLFSAGRDTRGAPSILNWSDTTGAHTFQQQLQAATKGEGGFVPYSIPSPDTRGNSHLISYVRVIPEWQWLIGESISLDPIEKIIQSQRAQLSKQVHNHTLQILAILAGMVIVIYGIALFIAYKTHIGLDSFALFFEKASSESAKIAVKDLYFSEFQRIGVSANRMIDTVTRATEELKRSESRFRALIEKGREIISVVNADNIILYETPSIGSVLGYTPREVVGKSFFDFLHPDTQEVMHTLLDEVKRTDGLSLAATCILKHADGSLRTFECSATNHLTDPHIQAVVINGRDVTERMRSEEQLRLMQFSIDHSEDAVYWINSEARFLYVNEGCIKMWGYSRDELLHMRIHDLDPDLNPALWPFHWQDVKTRLSFSRRRGI